MEEVLIYLKRGEVDEYSDLFDNKLIKLNQEFESQKRII
jgi:hypothetical protein